MAETTTMQERALAMAERVRAGQLSPETESSIERVRAVVAAHGAGRVTADAVTVAEMCPPEVIPAVVRLLVDARACERERLLGSTSTGVTS